MATAVEDRPCVPRGIRDREGRGTVHLLLLIEAGVGASLPWGTGCHTQPDPKLPELGCLFPSPGHLHFPCKNQVYVKLDFLRILCAGPESQVVGGRLLDGILGNHLLYSESCPTLLGKLLRTP